MSQRKARRRGRPPHYVCGRCGALGHNALTCGRRKAPERPSGLTGPALSNLCELEWLTRLEGFASPRLWRDRIWPEKSREAADYQFLRLTRLLRRLGVAFDCVLITEAEGGQHVTEPMGLRRPGAGGETGIVLRLPRRLRRLCERF